MINYPRTALSQKIIMKISSFVIMVVVLSLTSPAQAFWNSNFKKANDLIKIDRFHEAAALIDKEILENPLKPSVHFEAGKIYNEMG